MSDKNWTLIDMDIPIECIVDDRKICIKAMTNGEKLLLLKKMQNFSPSEDDQTAIFAKFDELLNLVGDCIISIEGFEDENPSVILANLNNFKTQNAIVGAVVKAIGVIGEDEKNSDSSSLQ